jgi:hypothetical protein
MRSYRHERIELRKYERMHESFLAIKCIVIGVNCYGVDKLQFPFP